MAHPQLGWVRFLGIKEILRAHSGSGPAEDRVDGVQRVEIGFGRRFKDELSRKLVSDIVLGVRVVLLQRPEGAHVPDLPGDFMDDRMVSLKGSAQEPVSLVDAQDGPLAVFAAVVQARPALPEKQLGVEYLRVVVEVGEIEDDGFSAMHDRGQ